MQNKYVLVTGSSGELGFSIAKRFLDEGATVGAHYFQNRSGAEKLLESSSPSQCRLFQADLGSSKDVVKLIDDFLAWKGSIDILVNNAGIVDHPAPLSDLTEASWDRTFHVNVKAPFFLSRAAMSAMKKNKRGRIINISSIGVKFGGGTSTIHYSASKAALEAVTRSLAKEGAPYTILVNAIRVGVADTEFHKKMGRHDLSGRIDKIPLKRAVLPEEVAETVCFLSSDAVSYITGTILPLSGGE